MKVFTVGTDAGWTFLIAAHSIEEAYKMGVDSDMGYVDFDSVREMDYKIFTSADHPEVLAEF